MLLVAARLKIECSSQLATTQGPHYSRDTPTPGARNRATRPGNYGLLQLLHMSDMIHSRCAVFVHEAVFCRVGQPSK